jgi:CO dehydrogenase maturation factor
VKIAVMGKGGVGKTVISGILARSMARGGWQVVALDCDSNPNLGISLGAGVAATQRLVAIRQGLEEETVEHAPSVEEMLERFGLAGPDGVRLAVVTQIDTPDPG